MVDAPVRRTENPSKGDVANDVARALQAAAEGDPKVTGLPTYVESMSVGANEVNIKTKKGRNIQVLVRFPQK